MTVYGLVEKWGGTSLATADRDIGALHHTVNTYKSEVAADGYTILVCSGPGKTGNTPESRKATDHAYDIVKNIHRNSEWKILEDILLKKVHDHQLPQSTIESLMLEARNILESGTLDSEAEAKIIGLPERAEARVLYELGRHHFPDLNFVLLDYHNNGMLGIPSEKNCDVLVTHGESLQHIHQLAKELKGKITIVPGFIGTKLGTKEMVTLERGMSDGTATYYGAALYLHDVRIFSDQNGILPIDPEIVAGLHPLPELTYREAEAFAGLGAKIINDVALRPARERGILVSILNSFDFSQTGTKIRANPSLAHYGVKAIAHVPGYELVTVFDMRMNEKGVAANVARTFAENSISIDSEVDGDSCRTYAVIPTALLQKARMQLEQQGYRSTTANRMSRLAIIGEGMDAVRRYGQETPEEILLRTLRQQGLSVEMHSFSRNSVIQSVFIPQEYTHRAVTHLYRAFGFHRNEK
ncbi:aspartate kinase [Candidatus Woesearchaeota archaeon]|nr:aspartate kinase [Candidatus Woesearchaeota archaeon]